VVAGNPLNYAEKKGGTLMLYWIYDIPVLLALGLFALVFVGVFWLGTVFVSPALSQWVQGKAKLNEVLGDYLQYFGVIYGLLLGLLAVATYQNHTDVEKAVASEAASLAALYRDISAYPEPDSSELKALIKEYTRSTIEDAWPLQRKGIDPWKINRAAPMHARLAVFEAQTNAQKSLHDAALRQFNDFFEARRLRIFSVTAGIPPIMWYVVALGALINMLLMWMFDLRLRTHLLLGGILSLFTGTMICLIVLLDNPFRGVVGVSPQPFELIYSQMMSE
jgi:hypothetical protein